MEKTPKPGPTVGPKVAPAGSAVMATATPTTESMGANNLAGPRVRSLAPTRLGLPWQAKGPRSPRPVREPGWRSGTAEMTFI
jgi:hypothetical protein